MTNEQRQLNFLTLVMLILALITTGMLLTSCAGPKGDPGAQGAPGVDGINGTSPVITTQPSTVSECLTGGVDISVNGNVTSICNGAVGQTGATGAMGQTGATGATGATGQAGTPGTQIQFVQFCHGFVPQYPSTFPEYGMVVNGQVYGVYSANGGFLALLPPGQYSSNGINSSCIFTINNNGTISQ